MVRFLSFDIIETSNHGDINFLTTRRTRNWNEGHRFGMVHGQDRLQKWNFPNDTRMGTGYNIDKGRILKEIISYLCVSCE